MAHVFPLLESWAPSAVVSTSDLWPFEYQVAYQASLLSIPSFVIQHGISDESWWPFQADKFVAWGDAFVEKMRQVGTPANRLVIGGMPASDSVFQRHHSVERGGRKRGTCALPVCLVLSHTHGRTVEPAPFSLFKEFLAETIKLDAPVEVEG